MSITEKLLLNWYFSITVLSCTVFSWNQKQRISRPCCSKLPIYLPIYLFLNKFGQFVSVISSKSNIQYTFVLKSQTLNEEFVYLHYFMKKSGFSDSGLVDWFDEVLINPRNKICFKKRKDLMSNLPLCHKF